MSEEMLDDLTVYEFSLVLYPANPKTRVERIEVREEEE